MLNKTLVTYSLTIISAWLWLLLPMSAIVNFCLPNWILLLLIYWNLSNSKHFGLINSWIIGVLTDLVTNSQLGLHGLIFSLSSYYCLKLEDSINSSLWWQQASHICLIMILSGYLLLGFNCWQGSMEIGWRLWSANLIAGITSGLLWPLLVVVLSMMNSTRTRESYWLR